ncbi:hypothetical protein NIB75_18965 [Bacteroides uniformis]|nr:hypothetical protein [Bacteroides uniformis]
MQREHTAAGTLYRSKRRAAINRIQYSKAPSLENLPFASMLNAYMGYSPDPFGTDEGHRLFQHHGIGTFHPPCGGQRPQDIRDPF